MEDDSNFVHLKYGNIRTLFAKVRGSFRVYLFSSLERNLLKAEVREKERTKTRIWWWWFCFSCNQSIMCCLWTFVELLLLVNYLKWELAMHQANSIKRKNKKKWKVIGLVIFDFFSTESFYNNEKETICEYLLSIKLTKVLGLEHTIENIIIA